MTITDLRKDCALHGIKVKIKTYSHGPHATFIINGIHSTSVMSNTDYTARREAFIALQAIKLKYQNLLYKNQYLYGLKSN